MSAGKQKIRTVLCEHDSIWPSPYLEVFVDGMGTCNMAEGEGHPVCLEFCEGKWVLHVWADINQEDATHRIDLSGALESSRTEE